MGSIYIIVWFQVLYIYFFVYFIFLTQFLIVPSTTGPNAIPREFSPKKIAPPSIRIEPQRKMNTSTKMFLSLIASTLCILFYQYQLSKGMVGDDLGQLDNTANEVRSVEASLMVRHQQLHQRQSEFVVVEDESTSVTTTTTTSTPPTTITASGPSSSLVARSKTTPSTTTTTTVVTNARNCPNHTNTMSTITTTTSAKITATVTSYKINQF